VSIGYAIDKQGYSSDQVVSRIFMGTDPAAAAETYAELAALGDGPAGDRLRCLFERLVTLLQGAAYIHHGCLIWPDGRPIDNGELARLVLWDVTTIEADLRELARVGLMELIHLEGCHP